MQGNSLKNLKMFSIKKQFLVKVLTIKQALTNCSQRNHLKKRSKHIRNTDNLLQYNNSYAAAVESLGNDYLSILMYGVHLHEPLR